MVETVKIDDVEKALHLVQEAGRTCDELNLDVAEFVTTKYNLRIIASCIEFTASYMRAEGKKMVLK